MICGLSSSQPSHCTDRTIRFCVLWETHTPSTWRQMIINYQSMLNQKKTDGQMCESWRESRIITKRTTCAVNNTVLVTKETSKTTLYEVFRNLLPKLRGSVYPYARSYESEIPSSASQQTTDACNACCWGCYRSSSSPGSCYNPYTGPDIPLL